MKSNVQRMKADLCVIGAGSAGLSVAAGASQMGASVVLIEKGKMGGDCLNTGCVPSKSLIAAAQAAHTLQTASRFGVNVSPPQIDFHRVHAHIHGVIAAIAPHDSVERFEDLGVRVIQGAARFVAPSEVDVDGTLISARRFVIATGSKAAVPPIPGLDRVAYHTNETIFDITDRPDHLVIIGGGPIGLEMAQAYRRLGARVSVIEQAVILAKDEPEAVEIVRQTLIAEGVDLFENTAISSVQHTNSGIELGAIKDGSQGVFSASHLLIATGRKPSIHGLNLEVAGVAYTPSGITVDARLRTENKAIFAIGDCTGGPQFTHVAGYHAGIVIRNALFGLPSRVDYKALPWVTYTDPELAHVGLTEASAKAAGDEVKVLSWSFDENDRAQAELSAQGLAKIVLGPKGKILGATIVGPHAGELISLWGLALSSNLKISKIASLLAPYPTLSEISKRAAGSYYTPTLSSPRTRKIVKFIQRVLP
jgi:pyruvate/2-oxoglutarate dehydrogenase complex dihydrolipoamide dehydrogenase (E3) component